MTGNKSELACERIAVLMRDGRERTSDDVANNLKISRMAACSNLKRMGNLKELRRTRLDGLMVYKGVPATNP